MLTNGPDMGLRSFGGADGLNLLVFNLYHRSESDPDVVFDKKLIFLSFLL